MFSYSRYLDDNKKSCLSIRRFKHKWGKQVGESCIPITGSFLAITVEPCAPHLQDKCKIELDPFFVQPTFESLFAFERNISLSELNWGGTLTRKSAGVKFLDCVHRVNKAAMAGIVISVHLVR